MCCVDFKDKHVGGIINVSAVENTVDNVFILQSNVINLTVIVPLGWLYSQVNHRSLTDLWMVL